MTCIIQLHSNAGWAVFNCILRCNMSRVASDSAWKWRVLKEEAVLERKNSALSRLSNRSGDQHRSGVISSNSRPASAHEVKSQRTVSRQPTPTQLGTGIPNAQGIQQSGRGNVNLTSIPMIRKSPSPVPGASARTVDDDAMSVGSYSSGTSIQSYPSSRYVFLSFSPIVFFPLKGIEPIFSKNVWKKWSERKNDFIHAFEDRAS